jgi:UDP-N-acetylmuramate dehydrogenase
MRTALHQKLADLLGERCAFDVPMAPLTLWQVGGPADCVVRPRTTAEIGEIFRLCAADNQAARVIGAASNLLVLDGGLRGVTILLRQGFDNFDVGIADDGAATAAIGAAMPMPDAVERAIAAGLAGLEFIAGVPGSIGGGVRMNAGTKLGDFSGALVEIEYVDAAGKVRRLPREKLTYRYRGLAIDGPFAVTEAVLQLKRDDPAVIRACVDDIIARRRERHPLHLPSCGSTFKNPEGDYAARLIEAAGLKGHQIGGAQVSEKHANFFLNTGGATAADILALIEYAREAVYRKFGVWLEPEVKIWGERDVEK